VLALFGPGAVAVAAAGISLSTNSGAAGTTTTVSGSGFNANAIVRVLFGGGSGSLLGSQSTDGSGNFSGLSVTIPSVTAGTYEIVATDGPNRATASFTVPSSLVLTPTGGAAGSSVSISGTGLLANEGVIVGWDQPGNQLVTTTSNGNGGFSTSFTAPNGSGTGNHTVFATGQSSHFMVSATFNVTSNSNTGGANLTVNPGSGAAGRSVSLNGTGFGASEQVNLAIDGNGASSVTSDGNGNFATSLQLSTSLGVGGHTISATGVTSGHSASVPFFVINQQAVACGQGEDRHGNGFGDDNHCHTGSQGHHEHGDDGNSQGHGHGHDGQGDDNQQGDDD
jgi:hypothetical protein